MIIERAKQAATVGAPIVALLVTACTASEPAAEQVEVTRVVERIVEVPVTVLVTPTLPTVTPEPPPTPMLQATVVPSQAMTGAALEYLQIFFTNYGNHLRANAGYFTWDAPGLDVFFDVALVVDDNVHCETARVYRSSGEPEPICDLVFRSHTTVQHLSVQTPQGDLMCERQGLSQPLATYFHCSRLSSNTTLTHITIIFVNEGNLLRAYAAPDFLWDAPDLELFFDVDLVVDDSQRCDTARIRWDSVRSEEPVVICDLTFRSHYYRSTPICSDSPGKTLSANETTSRTHIIRTSSVLDGIS